MPRTLPRASTDEVEVLQPEAKRSRLAQVLAANADMRLEVPIWKAFTVTPSCENVQRQERFFPSCLIQYSLLGATQLRCGGLQFRLPAARGVADVRVLSDIFACEIPVAMEDRREPLKDLDA